MKIPGGYGWVYIGIKVNSIWYSAGFRCVNDNSVVPEEVSTSYTDINNNHVKHIKGYHLNFNMQLVDKNVASGLQNYLVNIFEKYYYQSDHADKYIYIYPNYDNTGTNWTSVSPYAFYNIILTEAPYISEICNYKFAGQVLNIKGVTRAMISEDDYKIRIYRESTTGAWGLSNAPQQGYVEPAIGVRT